MWVRFTADFAWRQPAFSIDYKAGGEHNVTRGCADEALTKGVAVRSPGKKRDEKREVRADGKGT
ncbi:hypothetical protein LJR098_002017 [Rhizobium sp. LjRoot98]|uniref:hypothetical protein n=1 Tax=unclassified Rhizobium TaxID=2613769 RepID=UPI000713B5F0|nr:hypothetical protein [Rhizobium sp. Root1204]KQV37743.1 hypothetical protein ASC96_26075 [Rhizobium sp. Root1204]